MLNNYYTLRHVAAFLNTRLSHRTILSIFSQEKAQLVIEIDTGECVIISCQPHLNGIYLHNRFTRARRNTVDVFPSSQGKKITSVSIHPSDRIVIFSLHTTERIEVSLFGTASNVVLFGIDGHVIGSFKRKKDETRARTDRQPGKNDPAASVLSTLKQSFPLLGAVLIREVATRASIPPGIPWRDLDETGKRSLERFIAHIQEELTTPRPRIYFPENDSPEFSPIPLQQFAGLREERFDDLNDAIRTFIARTHVTRGKASERDLLEKQLRTLLEKSRKTSAATEQDHASTPRSLDYERFGKLILTNLASIRNGVEEITLSDSGGTISIPLNPGLSPAANAQRYFEKAKRSREALKQSELRVGTLRERIKLLTQLIDDLSLLPEVDEFLERRSHELESLGISGRKKEAEKVPFRVFRVDGGFEVWAGKNSKSNDELTMRHARPNDLWFHARGSGGSHVILRIGSAKGEPGKKARSQAASIAAYFSKMKNSRMVPVAMTARKYVRKPKGAPAGTVAIEREEVIIVEPRLPEEKGR